MLDPKKTYDSMQVLAISGATHHLCGMKESGLIISVNRDEGVPVFDASDYAVTADLNKVLPMLIEEIKQIKGLE